MERWSGGKVAGQGGGGGGSLNLLEGMSHEYSTSHPPPPPTFSKLFFFCIVFECKYQCLQKKTTTLDCKIFVMNTLTHVSRTGYNSRTLKNVSTNLVDA